MVTGLIRLVPQVTGLISTGSTVLICHDVIQKWESASVHISACAEKLVLHWSHVCSSSYASLYSSV